MDGEFTLDNGFSTNRNLKLKDSDVKYARIEPITPTIYFRGKDNFEILRLEPNGDIFIHGKLAENDKHVVDGLRYFLLSHGY